MSTTLDLQLSTKPITAGVARSQSQTGWQPIDATLTALAALTMGVGTLLYSTGPDAPAALPIGTAGQALVSTGTAPAWSNTFSANKIIDAGTGVQSLLTLASSTGTGWSGILLKTGASHSAWSIGAQNIVNESLDFTPSTALGGSTFTTPAFVITGSGATNGLGIYTPGYGLFGATSLIGAERVRIAGGSVPGTPGATDVLIGGGSLKLGGNITLPTDAAYVSTTFSGVTESRFYTDASGTVISCTGNNKIALRTGDPGGTDRLVIDGLANTAVFTGSATSKSPTAGIGYSTGAGGTVTQATSKATGVTLNKVCGHITMNAAALTAGAKVSFVVTNSACAASTDGPHVWIASGGTANAYRASVTAVAAGSFTVTVENITAGSLSEAPIVGFVILKAVTS